MADPRSHGLTTTNSRGFFAPTATTRINPSQLLGAVQGGSVTATAPAASASPFSGLVDFSGLTPVPQASLPSKSISSTPQVNQPQSGLAGLAGRPTWADAIQGATQQPLRSPTELAAAAQTTPLMPRTDIYANFPTHLVNPDPLAWPVDINTVPHVQPGTGTASSPVGIPTLDKAPHVGGEPIDPMRAQPPLVWSPEAAAGIVEDGKLRSPAELADAVAALPPINPPTPGTAWPGPTEPTPGTAWPGPYVPGPARTFGLGGGPRSGTSTPTFSTTGT